MSKRSAKRARTISDPRAKPINWFEWVSATKTKNFMNKEPLLDWLDEHRPHAALYGSPRSPSQNSAEPNAVHDFLMQRGRTFEKNLYEYLLAKHPSQVTKICDGDPGDARSYQLYLKTIEEMRKGTPIILQGVMRHYESKTYGISDILIKSDYFELLVNKNPLTDKEAAINAPVLRRAGQTGHYLVVDVKWMTLPMRVNRIHLLNSGHIPAYKAQLYVYTQALEEMQGYAPAKAFILGRAWDARESATAAHESSRNCFDRLGTIDFAGVDSDYIARTEQAVAWIKRMRLEGHKWKLNPPTIPELRPNMKNKDDGPWHQEKERIAAELHDITCVWYCGTKQRQNAIDGGVTQWNDEKCTSKVLGFRQGSERADIIDAILEINRQDEDLVRPAHIQNNHRNWQLQPEDTIPEEFVVDIELAQNFVLPVEMPEASTFEGANSLISMIGCLYYEDGTWKYQNFTVKHLTLECEREILEAFYDFLMAKLRQRHEAKKSSIWRVWDRMTRAVGLHSDEKDAGMIEDMLINLYTWGHIERSTMLAACSRHPTSRINKSNLLQENWVNFLDVMYDEPVVIKDALSFGLKAIVRAMRKNELIKSNYDTLHWQGLDGLQAMIRTAKLDQQAKEAGVDLTEMPETKRIIDYNEVDCRAVQEIIEYLRNNHGSDEGAEESEASNYEADEEDAQSESEESDQESEIDPELSDDSEEEPPKKRKRTRASTASEPFANWKGIGYCCFCNDECNPASQSCGRCAREVSYPMK